MTAIHITLNIIVTYMVTFTFLVMVVVIVTDASTFVPASPNHLVRAQILEQIHIQLPQNLRLIVFNQLVVKPY